MANVYRGRWDGEANPKGMKIYAVLAADAVSIGDMMWFDERTRTAKPANHADAWTGTTDGSQGKVAEKFLGVAASAHAANDASITTVKIEGRGVFQFDVTTAATFEPGDLVTCSKDPSQSLLLAQAVDKGALVSPPHTNEHTTRAKELAIGKVVERKTAAASTVLVEILSVHAAGGGPRQYLTS